MSTTAVKERDVSHVAPAAFCKQRRKHWGWGGVFFFSHDLNPTVRKWPDTGKANGSVSRSIIGVWLAFSFIN